MPLCGCACLGKSSPISQSRAIKIQHPPSQLCMDKQTGTFSSHSYSDIPCLHKAVTREQFTRFLTELYTRCAFLHQEILVNAALNLQCDQQLVPIRVENDTKACRSRCARSTHSTA